jgi:hypothetical protein
MRARKFEGDMTMKTIKGWIPTGILTATLLLSATAANAGVITGGLTTDPSDPCTVDQQVSRRVPNQKLDWGVITGGLTGVITGGFTGVITGGFTGVITGGLTGIIVTDLKSDDPVNCGVITGG